MTARDSFPCQSFGKCEPIVTDFNHGIVRVYVFISRVFIYEPQSSDFGEIIAFKMHFFHYFFTLIQFSKPRTRLTRRTYTQEISETLRDLLCISKRNI